MRFPKLRPHKERTKTLDVFRGYRHEDCIGDGEFYDMQNLSARNAPMLSPRLPRGVVMNRPGATAVTYVHNLGVLFIKDGDLWTLTGRVLELGLTPGRKEFISFGKYVIILPDMKYFNTLWMGDCGDVGYDRTQSQGEATLTLCDREGEPYENVVTASQPPQTDKLWLDTSDTPHALKRYSQATQQWQTVADACVKLYAPGIGSGPVYEGDTVTISGISGAPHLNGAVRLLRVHSNALYFSGILDEALTQDCGETPIRVERLVPKMDFVIEAGNRLWGCRYGQNARGIMVNEIYCSRLGDFRNWESFHGLSTDSWVASVGTPGPFTGAVNLNGNPAFYKANHRHKVFISPTGAHQVVTQSCQGVQDRCGGSVVAVPGGAIYKTETGFALDNGATPVPMGEVFGKERYGNALGHYYAGKYYVCMEDDAGKPHLFTYDEATALWHREDNLKAVGFCQGWALEEDTGLLWDLSHQVDRSQEEETVLWMAQTGDLGLDIPEGKYLSRLTLRMSLEPGSKVSFWLKCDEEPFRELGEVRGTGLRSFSIPLRPRRCDHLRLMLKGEGDAKVCSITKTITEGGDPL